MISVWRYLFSSIRVFPQQRQIARSLGSSPLFQPPTHSRILPPKEKIPHHPRYGGAAFERKRQRTCASEVWTTSVYCEFFDELAFWDFILHHRLQRTLPQAGRGGGIDTRDRHINFYILRQPPKTRCFFHIIDFDLIWRGQLIPPQKYPLSKLDRQLDVMNTPIRNIEPMFFKWYFRSWK